MTLSVLGLLFALAAVGIGYWLNGEPSWFSWLGLGFTLCGVLRRVVEVMRKGEL